VTSPVESEILIAGIDSTAAVGDTDDVINDGMATMAEAGGVGGYDSANDEL
jgi:hypothetical protein